MLIYPSTEGSVILPHDYEGGLFDLCESDRWDSLEDWRKLWEKQNPFIPEYPVPQERMLQSGTDS